MSIVTYRQSLTKLRRLTASGAYPALTPTTDPGFMRSQIEIEMIQCDSQDHKTNPSQLRLTRMAKDSRP